MRTSCISVIVLTFFRGEEFAMPQLKKKLIISYVIWSGKK